jgi:CheY-like chemotaxis protein
MSSTEGNSCILVVDDDADIRDAVVEALNDEGYSAVARGDGASALAYLKEHPDPALVLLDWNMAPMNGLSFVQELRRQGSPVPPIVLFSADARTEKVEWAGAVGFLKKPVPIDELYAYAQRYCGRPPRLNGEQRLV